MAHFYVAAQGSRNMTTRLAGKSGAHTTAAGWRGAITTRIWHDESTGCDMFEVELTPWQGSPGKRRVIANGVLDATEE